MALEAKCVNHPGRVASALCPSCSRSVCSECTVKVEGINVCAACLAARARQAETRRRLSAGVGVIGRVVTPFLAMIGLTVVFFLYALLLSLIL